MPAKRSILLVAAALTLAACSSTASSPTPTAPPPPSAGVSEVPATATTAAPVTLTLLEDNNATTQAQNGALIAAYTAAHPNVTINVELRPGGTDGDNIIKTRLATGDMDDLMYYNSGALLAALHPEQTLVDLTGEPFVANIQESYLPVVAGSDGKGIFGVPTGTAMGGGVLYNKKVFASAGVTPPKSWADFEAAATKLKAAGIPPVIQSYGDSWTSQLFVLADNYNVMQAVPDWPNTYTHNKAQYASTPAAMNGFNILQEGNKQGWYQKDYQTTKFEAALKLLANGNGAMYPMLTFALANINTTYPDKINDIGFFALPGADAAKNGVTIWMPNGMFIPKTSKNIPAAKDFLAFIASVNGTKAVTLVVPPTGPYMVKGSALPDTVLPAVKDLAAYVDSGKNAPALEFLSPVKGPKLEQVCVAVGSGQMNAATGASTYDQDVEAARKQLGITEG